MATIAAKATSVPHSVSRSVLFVCLGNICRSPMAEAVFRSISASHQSPIPSTDPLIGEIDSAGTGASHVLSPPNWRTMFTLRRHGITDYQHAARIVTEGDFLSFDYILAMDRYNLEDLQSLRERAYSGTRTRRTKGTSTRADDDSDEENGWELEENAKLAQVRLFGDFGSHGEVHPQVGGGEIVQDPYYGGADSFEEVYQQAVRFSKAFLAYLEKNREMNDA